MGVYYNSSSRIDKKKLTKSKMPVSKYYFPDANLELTAKYNDNKSLTRVYKTRFEEKKVQTTFANTKFCQAYQIGNDPLHTATYIDERGNKIFMKMDASRPSSIQMKPDFTNPNFTILD